MSVVQRIAACAFLLLLARTAHAGYVEERDGRTIIHVTVSVLPDPSNSSTFNRAELAAVREFVRRFPEIFAARYRERYRANPGRYGNHAWDRVEIRLEPFTGIRVEGVETELLAIAGGTAPDILYVNFRRSDNYIQNRFLYPLDLPGDGYMTAMTPEELAFRVYPAVWPVLRRRGPDGDVRVWSIPFGGVLGKVLLFRKDLFDAAGVAYPTKDWTWEDLESALKRLTDPARDRHGIQLSRGKHEGFNWTTFLWSAGGDVMRCDEATGQWRCVFDTREAAVALEYYTRICAEPWRDAGGALRRGYSSKDASDGWDLWARGQIGLALANIDERLFATINPEVTGMVPVPLGPPDASGRRLRGGELNSRMLGLFSGIADPVVRDAAWEYMRWYDGEDAVRIKTRVMVEGGLGPFINPHYLRRFGYPEIERLSPPGWVEAFELAIASGKPEPFGRNSNFAYEMLSRPIQAAEQLAMRDKLRWGPEYYEERVAVMRGLLEQACAAANEEMMGIVTPRARLLRRACAAAVIAGIAATFLVLVRRVFGMFREPDAAGPRRRGGALRHAWAYALMVPAVLSILLWHYVPLLRGSVMAFQDYRIIGPSSWVGLDHFGDVLFDSRWWTALWNSLRYSFLVIFLTFLPPILLAMLLQEVPRGKLFFRTLYYLPAVTTGIVTVVLWRQFYAPTESGAMNALVMRLPAGAFVALGLAALALCLMLAARLRLHGRRGAAAAAVAAGFVLLAGITGLAGTILFPEGESVVASLVRIPLRLLDTLPEPLRWLSDPRSAMTACVLPMIWAGAGPGCLVYLAALKSIPDDYYEAADLDGATVLDKVLFIIFPMLKPLFIINFVGVFIGSWYGAMGNILVMTGGAANTETADLYLWYKAFTFLKFGPATAMAWMLASLLVGFTMYQLRILSRVEFKVSGVK